MTCKFFFRTKELGRVGLCFFEVSLTELLSDFYFYSIDFFDFVSELLPYPPEFGLEGEGGGLITPGLAFTDRKFLS